MSVSTVFYYLFLNQITEVYHCSESLSLPEESLEYSLTIQLAFEPLFVFLLQLIPVL